MKVLWGAQVRGDIDGQIQTQDIIPNRQSLVVFSRRGYIKRMKANFFAIQVGKAVTFVLSVEGLSFTQNALLDKSTLQKRWQWAHASKGHLILRMINKFTQMVPWIWQRHVCR